MKTSTKTIWFKTISILVVATFLLPTNAYARHFNRGRLLQDYDPTADIVGFAVTVAMPFVPQAALAVGGALGVAETATATFTAIGATMGASLGATPGLVSGNDTAAIIGGVTGGISGGFGTAGRLSALNELDIATHQLDKAGHFGTDAAEIARLQTEINNLRNATSMQQTVDNISIAIATHEVSTTLVKAAIDKWGMSPEGAQALGMVGGSVTGWTMASATPGGQQMLKDMYQEIHLPSQVDCDGR